jgi:hypothetical protein
MRDILLVEVTEQAYSLSPFLLKDSAYLVLARQGQPGEQLPYAHAIADILFRLLSAVLLQF